ncbi:MAG: hypothetical protein JNM93_00195 [Bacteriovoracaceae bacterium]|nr:hypothetical protein [Bacteriovoracaceae bacterium]
MPAQGLSKVKQTFFSIKTTCEIIVKSHAYVDHPERNFTTDEIIDLIRNSRGRFTENESEVAIKGSYLFYPKDALGNECKLVVLIKKEVEVRQEGSEDKLIIVCSAYRDEKNV